jgi:hypothetical protein
LPSHSDDPISFSCPKSFIEGFLVSLVSLPT